MAIPITNYPSFATLVPPTAFESIIANGGQRVYWMQSHSCPCLANTGSPQAQPECNTCYGRGTYWDPIQGPFIVLNTLVTWIGRNVDMGENIDPIWGQVEQGHPIITIPHTQLALWTNAMTNDIFVQVDAVMRFQSTLRVGYNQSVPAWQVLQSINIPASGAVVVEDPVTSQPVNGIAYSVSGGSVVLLPTAQYPNGYPNGTGYTVSYYAPIAWVLQEPFGGLPHIRPFGQGTTYPRRFKAAVLDMWLRSNLGSSANIGVQPSSMDTSSPSPSTSDTPNSQQSG